MRIVTVARKPCASGSTTENVVVRQAGALNIDACRLPFVTVKGGTLAQNTHLRKFVRRAKGESLFETSKKESQYKTASKGRWPANLVLQHKPGCRQSSEQVEVAGVSWECVGGCSVAAVGEQSGVSTTGDFRQRGQSSNTQQPGGWSTGPREHKDFFGDTGTAARFFKQVKP